jgi:prophage regulatory protein
MANTNHKKRTFLRRKQVEKRTGLSRSTIYLRIQEGTFPMPVNLGARAVGWIETEIEECMESRIEDRDSAQEVR